jgi:hypothetical protein
VGVTPASAACAGGTVCVVCCVCVHKLPVNRKRRASQDGASQQIAGCCAATLSLLIGLLLFLALCGSALDKDL